MLPREAAILILFGGVSLFAQQCDGNVIFDGPIRITKGGTYSGNWESVDPSVPAVFINTAEPVTIVNSRVRGPGDLIHYYLSPTGQAGSTAAVTVQQSCFVGTNSNAAGKYKGTPVWVQNSVSVVIENCDFEGGGSNGIWVQGYIGDHTLNNTIEIRKNRIHNMDGRVSDGNGGFLSTHQISHAIHLSEIHEVPGVEIAWNQIVNEPYQSAIDDSINIYNSSGTAASPMQIHDNYIQGGYEPDPSSANTLNYAGAAITTDGDYQTDPGVATGFLKIHDNQAVSQSRGGLNIALGHDMEIYLNRVVSHGQLIDGTNYSFSNGSGINQANYRNDPPGAFGNNSFHDNLSGMRLYQKGAWVRFLDYFWSVPAASESNDQRWTPISADAPTLADEANERLRWDEKLIANSIAVGSFLVDPALQGSVQLVSGNNQVGQPSSVLPAPLVVRVVNLSGAPVAGVSISFMVATANGTVNNHFSVTDGTGTASTGLTLGAAPAEAQVNVIAHGYASATFTLWITQPAPMLSGIGGVGGSVPAVTSLSHNALISIYGRNFLPAGVTGRRVLATEFVDGGLPTTMLGVCVDVAGQRAAILDVFPNQINAQVPTITGLSARLRVLTYCGTPVEGASNAEVLPVTTASPEFLYFQLNPDGRNPVVLVNAATGALVGPPDILNGALVSARPGEVLTAYGTGFGPLVQSLATGQMPTGADSAVGPISVSIGGVFLAPADILYAGAAPGQIIDQLNFRIPKGIPPGNQPLIVTIAGVDSPPNAFVSLQQ